MKLDVAFYQDSVIPVDLLQEDNSFSLTYGEIQTLTNLVNDYNELINKPSINNVAIQQNVTLEQLGLKGIYYDTTAAWNMMPDMVGEEGYIYVYSDHERLEDELGNVIYVPGIRIGDGMAYLKDLPFLSSGLADSLLKHINNTIVHITAQERAFWNNKVSCYIDGSDNENLVLSKINYVTEGDILYG